MSFTIPISTTISQIVFLPFKIIAIIVLTPIIRFFQILKYGLFVIPTRAITNVINLMLLPFNFLKPTMDIDYSMISILKDLEIMYQFIICSIALGISVGCIIGVVFCTINYLLTFTNTEWKLFDLYIPWKGVMSKKPARSSSVLEELKLKKEKQNDNVNVGNDVDDGKMFTYVDDHLVDSIYEDDDGYGLKLNNNNNDRSSVSLGSSTNTASSTRDEGNSTTLSSSSSSVTTASNNMTGSTSVTSYTEGEEEDGVNELRNRMLKSKRRINSTFINDDGIESESATDTETETEGDDNDQFFDSPNRLITTIVEE